MPLEGMEIDNSLEDNTSEQAIEVSQEDGAEMTPEEIQNVLESHVEGLSVESVESMDEVFEDIPESVLSKVRDNPTLVRRVMKTLLAPALMMGLGMGMANDAEASEVDITDYGAKYSQQFDNGEGDDNNKDKDNQSNGKIKVYGAGDRVSVNDNPYDSAAYGGGNTGVVEVMNNAGYGAADYGSTYDNAMDELQKRGMSTQQAHGTIFY